MATFWASQTGGGNGLTQGSPTTVSGGIALMALGDTLKLLDGTYTGSSSMISVISKNTGTQESHRRTISALNDGAVTIDGQNVRVPVDLADSTFWAIEGINCKRSNSDVFKVRGFDAGPVRNSFHQIKRSIAWDTVATDNRHGITVHHINDVLIEDCAAFGKMRKCISAFKTNRVTVRRCWTRWNRFNDAQPKSGTDVAYNAHNELIENCIFEWDKLDSSGNNFGNIAITGQINSDYSTDYVSNLKILGCLAYALTGQATGQSALFFLSTNSTGNTDTSSCTHASSTPGVFNCTTGVTIKHCVGLVQPTGTSIEPFIGSDSMTGASAVDVADNLTSIHGTSGTPSVFTGNWNATNYLSQATVGAYNLYAVPPNALGATIRFRYVDGVLTATELWPFPMANRIEAALLAGGYASHNINTVIQNLFGTFPSTGGDVTAPTAPTGLTVVRL